jgi:hypothetical protein
MDLILSCLYQEVSFSDKFREADYEQKISIQADYYLLVSGFSSPFPLLTYLFLEYFFIGFHSIFSQPEKRSYKGNS